MDLIVNEKLNKWINILTCIFSLFLFYAFSRRGGDIAQWSILGVVILTFLKIIIQKKYNFLNCVFITGTIYLALLAYLFFNSENIRENLNIFLGMTLYSVVFMFFISNLEIDKKYYKYIIPLFTLSSFGPIYRGIRDMVENYKILSYYRIAAGTYTTVYALELGIYLLVGVIGILYNKNKLTKCVYLVYVLLISILIMHTQSRTTMLGIILPLFLLLVLWNFKKGIIVFIILILSTYILYTSFPNFKPFIRVKTLIGTEKIEKTERYPIFKRGIEIGQDNKYKGMGFYHYKEKNFKVESLGNSRFPHFHNILIESFVTQGIVVTLSFMAFLLCLFIKLIKNYFESKENRNIKILGIVVFSFGMIYGMSEPIFYFTKLYELIFTIIGISLSIGNNDREKL